MPDPESVPDATTKHHFTGAGKPYEADTFNLNITVNAHVEVAGTDHANEALKATAAAAMQESDRKARGALSNIATTERTRVDSAQNSAESVPQLPSEKRPEPNGPDLVGRDIAVGPHASTLPPEDTIANSPTLSKHTIKLDGGAVNTLPAVQPTSPVTEEAQSLPSFRQLTGQLAPLTELAEAATQQDHRGLPKSRQHRQSHGSAASQSPIMTFLPPFPSTAQSPPASHQPHGHRSPSGNVNDGQSHGSPRPMTTYYTSQRRTSGLDVPPVQLPAIPSLPSNSSSGESYGHHSSGTEGYSTTQTTPFEGSMPPEGANRPILPPPPGLSVVPIGNFQCDYPGCNASPFQTQYLLSSHRNVHSNVRTHYCPVKDCPRSEGGKGFKRKNEMIRHGLVHASPGYVCPFCPDREHKYPRPDNLQRHVRVHHVDKDRDDPVLREVLAQRQEGGKQRRRRTQSSASHEPAS